MLKFKKDTNFDKLFINTSYVLDIIFWVETEWINDTKGNKLHLRNVVATQFKEDEEIQILLNVAEDEDSCDANQEPMEYFENGLDIRQQIVEFIKKHLEEIKYTIKDRQIKVIQYYKELIDNINEIGYKVYEDSQGFHDCIRLEIDTNNVFKDIDKDIKYEPCFYLFYGSQPDDADYSSDKNTGYIDYLYSDTDIGYGEGICILKDSDDKDEKYIFDTIVKSVKEKGYIK